MLHDYGYFQEHALLAPILQIVNAGNKYVFSLLVSEGSVYLNYDIVCKQNSIQDMYKQFCTLEFLNDVTLSNLPNNVLKLKKGATVILVRNIEQSICVMVLNW